MRSHLHDVASGLAAVIAIEYGHGGLLAGWASGLLDAAGRGGDALGQATRAGRERLRELALRAATALPGSGGETAAGQIAGISGAKAISLCAGAIAAGCLAAGVVPGVDALQSAEQHRHPDPPKQAVLRTSTAPTTVVPASVSGASGTQPAKKSTAGEEGKDVARRKTTVRIAPEARTGSSARPAVPGPAQTGTEFGADAAGVGTPVNPALTGSSSGGDASHGGSGESRLRSIGAAASRSEPRGTSEFGL